MGIEKDKSLLPYNSFRIEARAAQFVAITDKDQLKEMVEKAGELHPGAGRRQQYFVYKGCKGLGIQNGYPRH